MGNSFELIAQFLCLIGLTMRTDYQRRNDLFKCLNLSILKKNLLRDFKFFVYFK